MEHIFEQDSFCQENAGCFPAGCLGHCDSGCTGNCKGSCVSTSG